MSTHRTAEEAKQHYIEVMGDDLGSLYHALWNELAWLYSKWEEYVELYGTKPSRIEILNKAAGSFFELCKILFWRMLFYISRDSQTRQRVLEKKISL